MRRALSIFLLALFSVSLAMPVLFARVEGEAKLPACCRRDGKHRCAMMQTAGPVDGMAVRSGAARCGMFPRGSFAPMAGAATGAKPIYSIQAFVPSSGEWVPAAAAGFRFVSGNSWPKRGPPSFLR